MHDSHDAEGPSRVPGDIDQTIRPFDAREGAQCGPYRLLGRIGEGGMGEVWRAEQRTPVRRVVALKLIKPGMATREVITRFEIERQAMALMDHPYIAKVYDAGVTDDERPYIAMEYVAGERITDYCENNSLSIEERLKLFQKVCHALQHAHQKAVIHRDLKPSNILVVEIDGEPVPKVIDFGIAKATAQSLTDRSVATYVGQLIGTPLYMSPEQAGSDVSDVDTRADVYSLGVILYELLSGALPHDAEYFAKAALPEILRVLQEEAAPRPSSRVSTMGARTTAIAARRGLDARKLAGKLKGDLDWITLKALEKDRKRRYASAKELADDIERHLRIETIEARPPSASYRLSRFARRHKFGVGIAASAIVVLVGIMIWQSILLRVISDERDRAEAYELLSLARAQLEEDPNSAIAYGLSSLKIKPLSEARDVVRQALHKTPSREKLPVDGIGNNSWDVDVTRDGRYCAVAWSGTRSPVVVYDLEDRSMRRLDPIDEAVMPYSDDFSQVVFDADGAYVVSASDTGVANWRVADGVLTGFVSLGAEAGHRSPILHRLANPGHVWLSSVDPAGAVQWFDLELPGDALTKLGNSLSIDLEANEIHWPAVSPDGMFIADFVGRRLYLFPVESLDLEDGFEVGRHDDNLYHASFSADGRYLASVDIEGEIRIWDIRELPPRQIRSMRQATPSGMIKLSFDPHQPRFATTLSDDAAMIYDLRVSPPREPIRLEDRTHWTTAAAFLPDGSVVTARNGGLGPAIWHTHEHVEWTLAALPGLGPIVHSEVTEDGRHLLTWSTDGGIRRIPVGIDDPSTEAELLSVSEPFSFYQYGIFMRDGSYRRAVTGARRIVPSVHDLKRGEVRALDLVGPNYYPVALSESGATLALLCLDRPSDGQREALIVDMDRLEIVSRFNVELQLPFIMAPHNFRIRGENELRVLEQGRYFSYEFDEAKPVVVDTLCSVEDIELSFLLEETEAFLAHGTDHELRFIDIESDASIPLGSYPGQLLTAARYQASTGLLAVGFQPGSFAEVIDLESGERWHLPSGAFMSPGQFQFDPRSRFLLVMGDAWKLPLPKAFSSHHEADFVKELRTWTNLRAVEDSTGAQRYVLQALPYGEWKNGER